MIYPQVLLCNNSVPAENGQYKRLDDIAGFYCVEKTKSVRLRCQESDVEVTIGTAPCNVTSLSRNQLTCRPPAEQPPATGPDPSEAPEVVVIVGRSLRFVIGKLSYDSPNSGEAQLPKSAIIGVTIGSRISLPCLEFYLVFSQFRSMPLLVPRRLFYHLFSFVQPPF